MPEELMHFISPRELLEPLRRHQLLAAASDLPLEVKNLRKRSQKKWREAWHSTLFSYAYSEALNLDEMVFHPEEAEDRDYDATLQWNESGEPRAARLQLKEFVPKTLNSNPSFTLESIFDGLGPKKYPRASDLIVAIYINRAGSLGSIVVPPLQIKQLWLFGWSKPDQSELFLSGDLLGETNTWYIRYPEVS